MSFAGHVFDMIRRDKQNREMLKQHREHSRDIRRKQMTSKNFSFQPDITIEEFEQINCQLKEKEMEERQYTFRTALLFLGIALTAGLIVWLILFLADML